MNVVQFSVEPLLRVAQALPATPRIMAEVGRLLRDPRADLEEISAQLKQDTALAARLLRVANSAAFAQSETVASIEDAAALIGFQEVHRLVGAVAVDQFSQSHFPLYGFAGRRLRENALFVALLMEELAVSIREDPQAAYTIGLFRSLGKLALEKLATEADSITAFRPEIDHDLVLWEKQAFGIGANQATAIILEKWRFPREISRAIGEHFAPTVWSEPLIHLLNLSAGLAERAGYGLPFETPYWIESEVAHRNCGINPRKVPGHLDRVSAEFERLNRVIA